MILVGNTKNFIAMMEFFIIHKKTLQIIEKSSLINMIYKISDYFKKSFYYLINDEFYEGDTNEIEIKLKIDNKEYNRIFNLISKNSNAKKITKQIDTYYSFKAISN